MLDTEQAIQRAADLVAVARRMGADAAEAIYAGDAGSSIGVRLGELEEVERAEGEELSLRVFLGRRSASVASGDPSAAGMAALAERALAMARVATEDAFAGFAPDEMLHRGAPPALDLDDGGEVSADALRERALLAEEAARSVAGVTNSEGASASASRSVWALATSGGFSGGYATSAHGTSASVIAGTGVGMERDYDSHGARHLADLDPAEAIGRRAGERAVARLDPRLPPAGAMPVLFDRRVSTSLVGHLLGAMSGASVARRTSLFVDRLGDRVLPAGVSVLEDPHRPRGLRSRPFDAEGAVTRSRALIDDGGLATWLMDSAAARQLGLATTGHAARGHAGPPGISSTNVHLTAGARGVAAMIAGMRRGVIVTELIGQGVNAVTGDYSRGASGLLVEDGAVVGAASGFTIAGNLKDMFLALEPADDLVFRRAVNAPSVLVDGMTVASG